MGSEYIQPGGAGSLNEAGLARTQHQRISRRAALLRISAGSAVGVAAWVAPEILTAKPAAGGTLSGPPGTSALVISPGTPGLQPTTGSTSDGPPAILSS